VLDRLRWFRSLVLDLPQQLRLAYCLLRDPRVPVPAKAGVAAALGLVVVPVVDLPEALPVVGELDVVALSLLALRIFIAVCPADVVSEQQHLIRERRSRFDADVDAGGRVVTAIWRRLRSRGTPGLEAA
jgi:uncharacterized membrane protein YkvA (DUF1232 family)